MNDDIEFISFDLDGTLIPKEFADEFWLDRLPELYSKKSGLSEKRAKRKLLEEYDDMGREDIRWYLPDYWFSRYEIDEDPKDILSRLRKKYDLYEDAKDIIKELNRDYKLIITSNGHELFIQKGLGDYKKYFFKLYSAVTDFSSSRKTSEIYNKVCEDLKVSPNKVIHIGDDFENDYLSSKKAGLISFYLDREDMNGDLQDLYELKDIL